MARNVAAWVVPPGWRVVDVRGDAARATVEYHGAATRPDEWRAPSGTEPRIPAGYAVGIAVAHRSPAGVEWRAAVPLSRHGSILHRHWSDYLAECADIMARGADRGPYGQPLAGARIVVFRGR